MSLAASLERAASALPREADAIRPANGDPARLLRDLTPDAASRVLTWLLAEDPEAGEELALAWAELPAGEPVLAGVVEASLPKPGRKALRRALHRLRSRGVALPAAPRREMVATPPVLEDVFLEARVSRIDPSGAQLVALIEPSPGGGVRVFQGVVDEERGIVDFHAFSATRGQARRLLRDLEAGGRLALVEVSPEALRARLARIAGWQPADRAWPSAFAEWRGHLTETTPETRTPGEQVLRELGVPEGPEALERAAELVDRGEIGPWTPPADWLRGLVDTLQQAARSRVVVSDAQRRERAERLVREALEQRYAGDLGERLAVRLEETAYVWWRQGREDDARAALAAAQAFRERQPGENPVARRLLQRTIAPILAAVREEEKSSPLVRL